jgi:hypothetical protein
MSFRSSFPAFHLIVLGIQMFEEVWHQKNDNEDRQPNVQWERENHQGDQRSHLPSARGLRGERDELFQWSETHDHCIRI